MAIYIDKELLNARDSFVNYWMPVLREDSERAALVNFIEKATSPLTLAVKRRELGQCFLEKG